MKPAPFEYMAPESVDAALQLKARHGAGAQWLAGGQSLIPSLNFRCLKPDYVIDLNGLRELSYIRFESGQGVRLGGMTRYHELEHSDVIRQHAPMMHDAIPYIAHDAIRSRGTLGGSLAYADPAAELPTVTTALRARYLLRSESSERWVQAEDFFVGMFQTVMQPDELLIEVEIPLPKAGAAWGFIERSRRHGDRVLMGVAATLTLQPDGTCADARLVYQNGAPAPRLAPQAAASLNGKALTDEHIVAAAKQAAYEEIDPESDVHASSAFRRQLAFELTQRALRDARERGTAAISEEGAGA